jgi:hypothetical protein
MKKLIVVGSVFLLSLALFSLSACSDDDKTSCSDAVGHFYDQGCVLIINGDTVSRNDAIQGCNEEASYAAQCGCGGIYNNLKECFASIPQEGCNNCDSELQSYEDCVNNCSN